MYCRFGQAMHCCVEARLTMIKSKLSDVLWDSEIGNSSLRGGWADYNTITKVRCTARDLDKLLTAAWRPG